MPAMWGSYRWGYLFMGIVSLVWLIDSFVAMTLTFPLRRKTMGSEGPRQPVHMSRRLDWLRRWMPSWRIRPRTSAYKLTFDLHRAAGLWVWPIILTIAFTSFSLNLSDRKRTRLNSSP